MVKRMVIPKPVRWKNVDQRANPQDGLVEPQRPESRTVSRLVHGCKQCRQHRAVHKNRRDNPHRPETDVNEPSGACNYPEVKRKEKQSSVIVTLRQPLQICARNHLLPHTYQFVELFHFDSLIVMSIEARLTYCSSANLRNFSSSFNKSTIAMPPKTTTKDAVKKAVFKFYKHSQLVHKMEIRAKQLHKKL